jgi:hypothetical protein
LRNLKEGKIKVEEEFERWWNRMRKEMIERRFGKSKEMKDC